MSQKADKTSQAIQTAVKELGIDVPIYSAILLSDGSVEITTRDGTLTWKPKEAKPKPATKKKTASKPKATKTDTLPQEVEK